MQIFSSLDSPGWIVDLALLTLCVLRGPTVDKHMRNYYQSCLPVLAVIGRGQDLLKLTRSRKKSAMTPK